MLVMNSLAFFRLPLKEGHVPKRLVGVSADAIVGRSGIGLSGGIGDLGSGSLGSFSGSGLFDSSSGSGVSSNLASKGSTSFLGGSGSPGSGSLDFPSAIRDNPAKGLNTDSETGSLESLSC